VAPNTLIAGRVVDYKPATQKPFEEVRAIVKERVVQEEAAKLAKQAGEAKLAALKGKDDAAGFGDMKKVSRAKHDDFNNAAFDAVMKADVSKLPTYAGTELPQGFGIYRIVKVEQPANTEAAKQQAEHQQLNAGVASQEAFEYLEALKQKAKVKILKPVVASADTSDKPAQQDAAK
jgi:peptidyl-prolyl cis-trans isomerase D